MTFTKIAAACGVVLLGLLCWLAAIGVGIAREGLISFFVIVALVAGGNLLSGRGGHYGARARPFGTARPSTPGAGAPGAGETGGGTPAGSPPAPAGPGEPAP